MASIKNLLLVLLSFLFVGTAHAFSSNSAFVGNSRQITSVARSGSSLQMFFGQKKDDGKPGDYLCPVCWCTGFVISTLCQNCGVMVEKSWSAKRRWENVSFYSCSFFFSRIPWITHVDRTNLEMRIMRLLKWTKTSRIADTFSQRVQQHGRSLMMITDAHRAERQNSDLRRFQRALNQER